MAGWARALCLSGLMRTSNTLIVGPSVRGRNRSDIDICQGAEVAFARDDTELKEMIQRRKSGLAFSLGGMGSASTNFYNRAYARQGYGETATEVQRLWVEGKRAEAAAAVPDEMVLATTLIGSEDHVRERLRLWHDVGVNTVRLYPASEDLDERIDTLGRALDLTRNIT